MPEKYVCIMEILEIKGDGKTWGYSPGTCIICDKSCKGQKKIDEYDIHTTCYNKLPSDPHPRNERLAYMLRALE